MSDTETTDTATDTAEDTDAGNAETAAESDAETFSRDFVEQLRRESAKYRDRAKGADDLRHRLHEALVTIDGRLADPSDLPYSDEHLDDVGAAIAELIERKPHLARKPSGDVGQGVRSEHSVPLI